MRIDATTAAPPAANRRRRDWKEQAPAWALSVAVHLALLLTAGLVTWAVVRPPEPDAVLTLLPADALGEGNPGGTEGTGVGTPAPQRDAPNEQQLAAAAASAMPPTPEPAELAQALDALPALPGTALATASLAAPLASLQPGTGGPGGGGGPGGPGSGPFGQRVREMQRGVDLVLVLDATDSMAPYLDEARARLHEVIDVITGLVPDTRLGVVAFKDYGDEYGPDAVRALRLTGDLAAVRDFLDDLAAGGGADVPEPIHQALRVATGREMGWSLQRERIVILVSDASVHASGRSDARDQARQFARTRGTIHVIDVGGAGAEGAARRAVLGDLRDIAAAGGGAAFLLQDREAFWKRLVVLVFGPQFESDVNAILERYTR